MDKPRRRRLSPEARKLEIVEAAERLLQAQGARVRVEDVVREAGVAKGTFFLYFPTWDDLLETVRARLATEFETTHAPPPDAAIDWAERVETQAAAFVDFTQSRRGIGEAVFHSDFAQRRPQALDAVTRLASAIRSGQAVGAFGPVDPEPTARLLFAAIHDAADAVAAGGEREAILTALKTLLRRALAP
jgi:AcrR family transcriptional regulator